MLFGDLLHQLGGWAVRNLLDCVIPTHLLLGAEIWRRENFLHAKNLHALFRGIFDHRQMLLDVATLYVFDWAVSRPGVLCLNQSAFNYSGHVKLRDFF